MIRYLSFEIVFENLFNLINKFSIKFNYKQVVHINNDNNFVVVTNSKFNFARKMSH